ncbi:adenylyl-sulfate kinase [Kribbella sp. CA-294648]|uniref:adenylyl-sulfate kinase n=1 Tax=Kribbella sp. CA-294648 TaxID=3239948 RepID=UPI003D8CBAE4
MADLSLTAARISPDRRVLADVRLALDGIQLPFDDLGSAISAPDPAPAGRVRLIVSAELAETAMRTGCLVITDDQAGPIATLSELGRHDQSDSVALEGRLSPVRRERPADDRHLAPADLTTTAARLVVVVARPLTSTDLATIERESHRLDAEVVIVVPDAGPSPDGVPAHVLLACVDTAAARLGVAVTVTTSPLLWRPAAEADLAHRVGQAYSASEVLVIGDGDPATAWSTLYAELVAGHSIATDDDVLAAQLPQLLRWKPPRASRGLVVLFTGLSGSGKSTLAQSLVDHLVRTSGRTVTLLDGDVVRRMLSSGLGFTRGDRDLNVRRIGFVAAEIARHGGIAVCAPIAPYADSRAAVREMVEAVGDLVLIHVSTPLEECERRDVKGLYAKARAGLVEHFTGITDDYELPADADLRIDTSRLDRQTSLATVVDHLRTGGWIAPATG